MKTIRVLIVEDSPVVAEHLRRIIANDPRFNIVGIASSGEEALSMVERSSPDVISMDIHLPGMQGLEVTRRIMSKQPTPIVVVSGSYGTDVPISMQALQAGALTVVEKPRSVSHEDYAALAGKLCTQLAIMSEVKVLRQRGTDAQIGARFVPGPFTPSADQPFRVLGIAASTGGPSALMEVLCGLGRDFPLPIVIVQHMAGAFLQGFAEWLGSVAPFPISLVTAPTALEPGHVYLASGDSHHLALRGLTAYCDPGPPDGVHRPSANVLFSSMAESLGAACIGVLLTGMGEDGATGLLKLKRAGAWTIAEDQTTAAVYGMPAAAVRLGAVDQALPLPQIAPRILTVIATNREAECRTP